jgi:hypothetical protein
VAWPTDRVSVMDSDAIVPALRLRPQRALRPQLAPWPALVAITDTNTLLRRACYTAGHTGPELLITGLSGTGRSNAFAAGHVPEELVRHLPTVAASTGVDVAEAGRVLWGELMPTVPVVDLAVRDYLSPRALPLLRSGPEWPKGMLGDPDDIGTAALADFLAPAVILSADSVFTRLGLANTTALNLIETCRAFLQAAGFEATFADAALLAEVALRLVWVGGEALMRLAARYPVPALVIVAGVGWLAHKRGMLTAERARGLARRLGTAIEPWIDRFATAIEGHQRLGDSLFVIEPDDEPTLEQQVGRYLARSSGALIPAELRDALRLYGHKVSAAQIRRMMQEHSAFVRSPGDRYTIGRRISTSGGTHLAPPEDPKALGRPSTRRDDTARSGS